MKTLTKQKIHWLILIFQILFLGLVFAATAQPGASKTGREGSDAEASATTTFRNQSIHLNHH